MAPLDDIWSRLGERSKMIKKFDKYGKIRSHLDALQEKTDECTTLILGAHPKLNTESFRK